MLYNYIMSSISGNGAIESIFLQMSGPGASPMQYSVGATPGTWFTITTWPVTINNSNPTPGSSSILNVKATQSLMISSSTGGTSGYFIAGSTYITFDGSGNTITLSSVGAYPGFIRNGTSTTNGFANIIVQNINISAATSSLQTSPSFGGWVCQSYFGKGAASNIISNCTNTNGSLGTGGCGGIVGSSASGQGGDLTITGCTNNGSVGAYSAGIVGTGCVPGSGTLYVINCTNNGGLGGAEQSAGIVAVSACQGTSCKLYIRGCRNSAAVGVTDSGGILGRYLFNTTGTLGSNVIDVSGCINTGDVGGSRCGGIWPGTIHTGNNHTLIIQYCTNTGNITGGGAGGICSGNISISGTGHSITIKNCNNSGAISGTNCGGIVGNTTTTNQRGVSVVECYNTGLITGQYAGGIVGNSFGLGGTTNRFSITNCYNIGDISGNNAGGITGANIGNNLTASLPLDISNCYSLGIIRTTAGGICGGYNGTGYGIKPAINISNSYSYGTLVDAGSGLVAVSLTSTYITLTTANTYVGNGTWTDAAANAALTGTPTDISTNNPGTAWTKVVSGTTGNPYVLSAYNDNIYNPSSASTANNYTTSDGLYTDSSYSIIYSTQLSNVATIRVFAYKGTSPNYYSYNFNTFTYTNTTGSSGTISYRMTNTSTGVLTMGALALIAANGATEYVSLRMDTSGNNTIQYSTDQSTWNTLDPSFNWPVTIRNTNPTPGVSSILRTIATQNLTISSNSGGTSSYFIMDSSYITLDGSGNTMTITGITSYPGFIQNGTSSANGTSNIAVQNFTTTASGASTLANGGGWLCQQYFGRANTACSITNCTNNGDVNNTNAGGISGLYTGAGTGVVIFTNCTNNGVISGQYAGGIAGYYSGQTSTTPITFINCTNTGNMSGQNAGGIAGRESWANFSGCSNSGIIGSSGGGGLIGYQPGYVKSSMTFTNCTNSGNIIVGANNAGGLCGQFTLRGGSGTVTFTNCTNSGEVAAIGSGGLIGANSSITGTTDRITCNNCTNTGLISGSGAGGIIGSSSFSIRCINCTNTGNINGANSGGLCANNISSGAISNFISCSNTGDINGQSAGGICGQLAGTNSGKITTLNCFNVGNIIGLYAGGIFGEKFANNSNQTYVISNSYNVGNISGSQCGGIFGAGLGFGTTLNCVIDISNCYSIGSIPSTTGGIVGGTSGAFAATPTINITNCYAYDNTTPANSRIVSTTYPKSTTQTNCYAATTGWTDASANAALIGTPTDISTNNPGTTWTKVVSGTTGNPYVLSAYNAALYSPSSASTGVKIYTTSAGLFTPGYTYQIMYDSQTNVGNTKVDTTRVFASKGSTPKYYAYNNNTFTLTNTNGNTRDAITSSINAYTGVITYILPDAPCFLEGTKILSLKNNVEQYRPIESLRKGDLVKTINNGYLPIDMIGTTRIYNPGNNYRTPNRLYKCSKEKYPKLFEDLYITGCHSILVPYLTDEQWNKTKEIFGGIYVTDNHIRLMAWLDDNAEPFNNDGYFSIYHIALENSDFYMNYGIYANGLLVETCSKRYLRELSGMTLLGEEDCTASQYIGVENKVTHLIDTY